MDVSLPAPRRALALSSATASTLTVGALVAVSAAVRIAIAWARATPNYFPDEYLY